MPDYQGETLVCLGCRREDGSPPGPCWSCGGRRIATFPDLFSLSIGHVDCDAFYAAVEKRDDPALEDRPVIVGGGRRGVVTTACYVARTYGVRSAMPMFKALAACPEAVVIRPNFDKYAEAGRQVRAILGAASPLVEPVSIDEAFIDLTGTERILRRAPATTLASIQRQVKSEVGVTISVGLSGNKFLAKLASDLDKPEGFSAIPPSEAAPRLAPLPVSRIWGVGAATESRLAAIGLRTIGDVQRARPADLERSFGAFGRRLYDLAHGRDDRRVTPDRDAKSVSSETTFNEDIEGLSAIEAHVVRLAAEVARRMKAKGLEGRVVVIKLKDARFESRTRRRTLERPSALAHTLYETAHPLLTEMVRPGERYRLVGVGYAGLAPAAPAAQGDLFDAGGDATLTRSEGFARREAAIAAIRDKFGPDAIGLRRAVRRIAPASHSPRDRRRNDD